MEENVLDLDELQASNKLESFRRAQKDNKGISFHTISSAGPNSAIVHYRPEKDKCAIISRDKIYLLDSGGQYLDGTTDVTRTMHFGTPKEEEKDAYTRVLMGNLDIESLIMPLKSKISGADIDSIARRWLWEVKQGEICSSFI